MPSPAPSAQVDSDPQTPTLTSINTAVAYDWHRRVNEVEHELSVEHEKLKRANRRAERLRHQAQENAQAFESQAQGYARVVNQCQHLSNTNLALTQELEKRKLMVETLEAVIMMLYTHPLKGVVEAQRLVEKGSSEGGGHSVTD